jgi:2-dehydro-3-deoxyphosphogluconate aldolase / (4S)-4-hydroxy-2-oxoglutarate aldolase
MTADGLLAHLCAVPVVGIVRSSSAPEAVDRGLRLASAGVHVVEVSLSVPAALTAISQLAGRLDPSRYAVGAGTVLTARDAHDALSHGASFLISPILDLEVLALARERQVLLVPGVATPTEAVTAARAGAVLQKLFPASNWSPASLKDLLQPLPSLALIPTGGIDLRAAQGWIRAGATAVGIGTALLRLSDSELALAVATLRDLAASRSGPPGFRATEEPVP